ncbi:MAG: hypothetical protein HYX55_10695 [Chloroflexi bacterium]|nr:hypothetical protein [Chloroflexota bacterium]
MSNAAPHVAPYAPSALNRLYAAVERLPGGGWWVYPLLLIALIAYHEVSLWATGSRPVGTFTTDGLSGLAYGPYTLAALHYLLRIADQAAVRFKPASGMSDEVFEQRRYELVTLPGGRLWVVLVIGALAAAGAVLYAPPEAIAWYGGKGSTALIVLGPAALFGYTMFPVVIYQSVRQLRLVERFHRDATAIDMFDTGPIFAFSRLTMQIGLAFVFAGYYSLTVNASFQAGNLISLAIIATTILLGIACFIVPLWGIHGRLMAEKDLLVRGVNLRSQALQQELYRRVDAANLVGVKDVTDALGGITATREQIHRLPTWPWPPQVLRGFITAIVLPVLIFLISRYVGAQAHLV